MQHIIDYAKSFLGVPYKFGSNNINDGGIDCSGFVCELLRAAGELGKEDLSAQGIYERLEGNASLVGGPGSILFFGESVTKITHVAFALDNYLMIEAGGGDASTQDIKIAAKQNAMVRIRTLKWRKDLVASLKPRYAALGMSLGSRI